MEISKTLKRHAFTGFMTLLSVCLSGCQNSEHSGHSTALVASNDTIPPDSRAYQMMKDGKPFEEYMPVQMEAISQLRNGKPQSDAITILSQTGHYLMRHGDYAEALEYLQEASDSAQKRVAENRIDASMIHLHGNLATMYIRFGLSEEALEENSKAIEMSRLNNFKYGSDMWRSRGAIFAVMMKNAENKREITDSILHCLQMARKLIPLMDSEDRPMYRAKCNFDKAALFVENPDFFADSIAEAIRILENFDTISGGTHGNSKNVLLGRAYVLNGRTNEGIKLLEAGLQENKRQNWKEAIEWNLQLLALSYAESGHGQKLASIFPEVEAAENDIMNQTKINTLIGANFKYRLRDKQREVDMLKKENETWEKIIILGGVVLMVGLLVGTFLTYTYLRLKSKSRRETEIHKKEISDILSHQVILNNKIEQLNEQLTNNENKTVIENVMEQLNPALLSGEDETKFRRAFISLHPHFLKNLRRDYPALTSGDELLCMLIYLRVPPIDMAASLGISRPSLNSARYRLRKRLNLDKDTDLDTFLQTQ